jgi:transcription elongation GreA/GreB family factor
VLETRAARLESLLESATVVDAVTGPSQAAGIGTTVTVQDTHSGKIAQQHLLGAHQTLAPGDLSSASAVGRALLEQTRGSTVRCEVPTGRTRSVMIVDVEVPHQSSGATASTVSA